MHHVIDYQVESIQHLPTWFLTAIPNIPNIPAPSLSISLSNIDIYISGMDGMFVKGIMLMVSDTGFYSHILGVVYIGAFFRQQPYQTYHAL